MDVAGGVLILAGALWCLLAAVGVMRFEDVFSRMHAGTKATTLGLILVVIGAALRLEPGDALKLLLAGLLVLVTQPVGAHLIGRATHSTPGAGHIRIDTVDELADAEQADAERAEAAQADAERAEAEREDAERAEAERADAEREP